MQLLLPKFTFTSATAYSVLQSLLLHQLQPTVYYLMQVFVIYLRRILTNIYRVTALHRRRMVSLFLQWKGHDTHKMFNKTSFPANLGLFFRPIFRSVFLMKYKNTSTLPTFSYQPAKSQHSGRYFLLKMFLSVILYVASVLIKINALFAKTYTAEEWYTVIIYNWTPIFKLWLLNYHNYNKGLFLTVKRRKALHKMIFIYTFSQTRFFVWFSTLIFPFY